MASLSLATILILIGIGGIGLSLGSRVFVIEKYGLRSTRIRKPEIWWSRESIKTFVDSLSPFSRQLREDVVFWGGKMLWKSARLFTRIALVYRKVILKLLKRLDRRK